MIGSVCFLKALLANSNLHHKIFEGNCKQILARYAWKIFLKNHQVTCKEDLTTVKDILNTD